MKNIKSFCVLLFLVAGLSAFNPVTETSITGRVRPANGASTVSAINGTDTTRSNILAGTFTIDVKPGVYKLLIDAADPYKDVQLLNLEVKEYQVLDVGEIILQQ